MKLLSDKLIERFKKLNLAFRFFDLKSSGKLTFNDFTYGIE
jgi:Ca2+-binding EF-hand superfamily protein